MREVARKLKTTSGTLRLNNPVLVQMIASDRKAELHKLKETVGVELNGAIDAATKSPHTVPKSLTSISHEYNTGRATIKKWYPDLCKSLVELRKVCAHSCKERRKKQILVLIEQTYIELHQAGIYPSKNKISHKILGNNYLFTKPGTKEKYGEIMTKLGYRIGEPNQ